MTREEAIRYCGDIIAKANIDGNEDANPIMFATAMFALGVTEEELHAVSRRASAEFQAEIDRLS